MSSSKLAPYIGGSFVLGCCFFCGSLYGKGVGKSENVKLAPLGGMGIIAGFIGLMMS